MIPALSDLPEWHLKAACRGANTAMFFPEAGQGRGPGDRAKAICAGCAVQSECLDWAVENMEPAGIWGGLSERQRRKVRAERAA